MLQPVNQFLDQSRTWQQFAALFEVIKCTMILAEHLSRLCSNQICLHNIDIVILLNVVLGGEMGALEIDDMRAQTHSLLKLMKLQVSD